MARNKIYFKKQAQTIAMQAASLKSAFPDSKITLERNNGMVWVGKLQPTPLSATYTLRIKYRLDERPEVTVLDPILLSRDGTRLPHVFKGNLLCLFRYKYHEWDSTILIVNTIVPWTSLWLSHYEVWYATGVWCGSKEEHPSNDDSKKPAG
jgi:hypothetical protein